MRGGLLLLVALFALAGCVEPLADGLPSDVTCDSCHGSEGDPAPPLDVDGGSATTRIGVGAHRQHLTGGTIGTAVPCESCHVVPDAGDLEHVDTIPAEIVFAPLASQGGLTPVWDREQARCLNTYCHGGTLAGGTNSSPSWVIVDGSQMACGSCHGLPPPEPHPATSTGCATCHPDTFSESGGIDVSAGKHINGTVD